LTLVLTEVAPAGTALGLGFGVRHEARGCNLTVEAVGRAGSSPNITSSVGEGDYCFEVFDAGDVALSGASFSIVMQVSR
jgi:hypothetical protein